MAIWWLSLVLSLIGLAGLCALLGPQPRREEQAAVGPPGPRSQYPRAPFHVGARIAGHKAKPPA